MGWQRKQREKDRKFRRIESGSRDWTREQEQRKQEQQERENRDEGYADDRRQAG